MTPPVTKRRPRKPATTQALVPASPFVGFGDADKLIWAANFAYSPIKPVMQIDRDAWDVAMDRLHMEERAALQENHAHLDAVHAAINSGRDVSDRYDGSAYEAAYREAFTGCGDSEPPQEQLFTKTVSVPLPPVAEVVPEIAIIGSQTFPLGELDPEKEALDTDVFGPEQKPAGDPEPADGPEPAEDEPHEPALDKLSEGEQP